MKKLLYLLALLTTPAFAAGPLSQAEWAARHGSLTVTLLGDSITEGLNVNPERSWAARLSAALTTTFPGVQVFNRALASRYSGQYLQPDYVGMESEPSNLKTGYGPDAANHLPRPWVKPGQSWEAAVRETHPQLLVIAFGMNEVWTSMTTGGVERIWREHLNAVLDDAATWQPAPAVVLVTSPLPSATAPQGLPIIPADRIMAVAAVTRAVAAQRGLMLIDIQKSWCESAFSERELLGTWPGTVDGQDGGGNGYNHPTERATRELMLPALHTIVRTLLWGSE